MQYRSSCYIKGRLLEPRDACAAGLLLQVPHTEQECGRMRNQKVTSTAIVVVVVVVCPACSIQSLEVSLAIGDETDDVRRIGLTQNSRGVQGLLQALLGLILFGMLWTSDACVLLSTQPSKPLGLRQVLSHPLGRRKIGQ